MTGDKLKYLEMIQAVVARMAGNQVQLRTWGVALGTAIIGYVAAKDGHLKATLLGSLPAITFWILDGYYLALEKKFRDLFDQIRQQRDESIDFHMSVGTPTLKEWVAACLRPAVWLVYFPVLILSLGLGVWAYRIT